MRLTNSAPSLTRRDHRPLRCTALSAGCLGLLGLLAVVVRSGWRPLERFDLDWTGRFHEYAQDHTIWTAAVQTLSDLGGTTTMRSALGLAAIWLWLIGARVLATWVAAQALVGWGALWALKLSFDRQRPDFPDPVSHASGPAFPSGHAMASAITCAVLVALLWPRAGRGGRGAACAVAALAVVTVGWTRVALAVHWPTDVLAGWLSAGVVLGAVTVAVELWCPGSLARDVRRVKWRTRPRVQRVLAPTAGRTPDAPSAPLPDPEAPSGRRHAPGEDAVRGAAPGPDLPPPDETPH